MIQNMLSSAGDVNNDAENINSLLINVSDRCLKVVKVKMHKKEIRNILTLIVIRKEEKYVQRLAKLVNNRGGGRSTRLVRPFKKNLNLTIIGPTRTLKIQGFDHKYKDFWSDQGRTGRTGSAGPE